MKHQLFIFSPESSLVRVLAAVALTLCFFSADGLAQTPNDYYKAGQNKATKNLLHNVEKYHLQKGVDALRRGKYQYAWADLDFMLRYFPNHPRALMLMAEVCESWRDPKCKAEEYFSRAIELSPDQAPAHIILGIHQHQQGKYADAIQSYQTALSIAPNSGNAHYNLGLAYFAKGDYANANEHAQKAYDLGMTLPGLQQKLVKADAWKPRAAGEAAKAEPAPLSDANAANPPTIEGAPLAPPNARNSK
ncbi:MAG TPA: tetratricopeptide repeat protein [Burkholderiales bacterium]|nr:tetratricopeptide repeat protein [Burkholderiales bacterium]